MRKYVLNADLTLSIIALMLVCFVIVICNTVV
jgi:predicted small secreted protein